MIRFRLAWLLAATLLSGALAGCACPCCGLCGDGATAYSAGQRESQASRLAVAKPTASEEVIVRGQSPAGQPYGGYAQPAPVSDQYAKQPMPVSGGAPQPQYGFPPPAGYAQPSQPAYGQPVYSPQPAPQPTYAYQPPAAPGPAFPGPELPNPNLPPPPTEPLPAPNANPFTPVFPWFQPATNIPPTPEELAATPTPLDVFVEETRTGRFMFGVSVNSNAGVTGNITIDERNFDIARPPMSWDDFLNGTAWRGAGQGFRIEAQPGTKFQRYMFSFTEPYFLNTNVSFNASAFYFYRNYFDWNEDRVGGRLSWGYRLTPDLSISTALRGERVNIFQPRVTGVPELDAVVGNANNLYGGRVSLIRDTRDLAFMPTQGSMIELAYEQIFGTFDYPRGELNAAQYFMLRERPDGSGRHTVALSTHLGFLGADSPIFENYFAGGYTTLRGFAFRGASPLDSGVRVGGQFQWINSIEYFFPLTADDMMKGTFFCDFGTVEQNIALHGDQFRVAPGFGFRVNVPAMGPAPLAFDFAFPVASASGDSKQTFSFFFGASR